MRASIIAVLACLAFCVLAAGPRAELYKWTDEHGRIHVTDDGAKVPTGQTITLDPERPRAAGRASAKAASSASSVATTPAQPMAPAAVARLQNAPASAPIHVLHFQRAGQEISLDVSLEDRVSCNFKADTGASLNTIPSWAAEELGLEIDSDTPRISVVGVTGEPMRVPVVTIASLRIGTLYIENVEMAVLDTMNAGLLGMPFFNRFLVSIDPAQGELRLTEVGGEAAEGLYGGVPEETWRKRFEQINQQFAALQKARDSVPPESETQAQRFLERLDREEAKLQHQLDELESRAQAAGVPVRLR